MPHQRQAAWWVLAAAALACSPRSTTLTAVPVFTARVAPVPATSGGASAAPGVASAAPPALPTVEQLLCRGAAGCTVKLVPSSPTRAIAIAYNAQLTIDDQHPCPINEVWLVALDADGHVRDRQAVGSGCAPEPMLAPPCEGIPLISAKVDPTSSHAVVSWESQGPGCGGWTASSVDAELSFDSFKMLTRRESTSRLADPPNDSWRSWDFSGFALKSGWESGPADLGDGFHCRKIERGPYVGIPRLNLDPAVLDGAWRTANFQACSARIDRDHGVVPRGAARSDARLNVVLSEQGGLFIDVLAEPPPRAGATLEVCFGEWTMHDTSYCQIPAKPECTRIDLDGHVRSGHAAVERAPDRPRFRVTIPADHEALCVSYREPNGRTIASSDCVETDLTTLSDVFTFRPAFGKCRLVGQDLVFEAAARQPEHELLDPEPFE